MGRAGGVRLNQISGVRRCAGAITRVGLDFVAGWLDTLRAPIICNDWRFSRVTGLRPAIFLDRDDTLIDTRNATARTPFPGDLFDPALVRPLPGVLEACRELKRAGYALVVVSNQGAVAAGHATLSDVHETNERIRELLIDEQGKTLIDAIYFSPSRPGATGPHADMFNRDLSWRKPAPGMILAAQADLGLDLSCSWLVGDAMRDVQAGLNAGLARERCIMLTNQASAEHACIAPDLLAAAAVILRSR